MTKIPFLPILIPSTLVFSQDFSWASVWERQIELEKLKRTAPRSHGRSTNVRGVLHRKGGGDTVQEQNWDSLKADPSASNPGKDTRKMLIAELIKTSVLVLCAFFTIVFGTAAWFVSNTKVDSGGVEISHQYDTIRLATKGVRQSAESTLLKLDNGTPYPPDGEPHETYYVTEDKEIALRLSTPEVAVSPGMSGEISFYIIPNSNGPQTVTLHLGLAGYEKITKDSGSKINDIVLSSLLSGHILLFKSHENGLYSEWLPTDSVSTGGANYQITVSNPDAKAGKPWPVTIYWVWPLRYQNMAGDFGNIFGIFIEEQVENLKDVPGNKQYQYSQIFLTKRGALEFAEARSDAYNQADEYIGKNANYLYVTVQTDLVN